MENPNAFEPKHESASSGNQQGKVKDLLALGPADIIKAARKGEREHQDEYAKAYKDIFPQVTARSVMAPQAIWVIASHAKELGMAPLRPNRVRYFSQPWGYVGSALDVGLTSGTATRYALRVLRAGEPRNV
jgi:hypothetical protein